MLDPGAQLTRVHARSQLWLQAIYSSCARAAGLCQLPIRNDLMRPPINVRAMLYMSVQFTSCVTTNQSQGHLQVGGAREHLSPDLYTTKKYTPRLSCANRCQTFSHGLLLLSMPLSSLDSFSLTALKPTHNWQTGNTPWQPQRLPPRLQLAAPPTCKDDCCTQCAESCRLTPAALDTQAQRISASCALQRMLMRAHACQGGAACSKIACLASQSHVQASTLQGQHQPPPNHSLYVCERLLHVLPDILHVLNANGKAHLHTHAHTYTPGSCSRCWRARHAGGQKCVGARQQQQLTLATPSNSRTDLRIGGSWFGAHASSRLG